MEGSVRLDCTPDLAGVAATRRVGAGTRNASSRLFSRNHPFDPKKVQSFAVPSTATGSSLPRSKDKQARLTPGRQLRRLSRRETLVSSASPLPSSLPGGPDAAADL